ncbi:MAG TPA: hypothetical protein VFB06_26765 [Streptosporangiaceae bacterium]|nr:hypothetical protein [Streptosporangiaceae bacterium]
MTEATDTGLTEMRVSKVVGFRGPDEHAIEAIVLDRADGNRHLVIQVGATEAFSLAAILGGIDWPRPMTYQFMAALRAGRTLELGLFSDAFASRAGASHPPSPRTRRASR